MRETSRSLPLEFRRSTDAVGDVREVYHTGRAFSMTVDVFNDYSSIE